MNKKVKFMSIFLVLVTGIFFFTSSCMEGLIDSPIDSEISLNHTYAMPLVEGSYTLDKVPIPIDTIWQDILDSLPVDIGLIDSLNDSYPIEIRDTMDANFGGGFEGMNESTLYISYVNSFPFDCNFRAILYDSVSMANIDTMLHLVIPGTSMVDGIAQVEEGTDSIIMGDDFFTSLEESNQMIVEAIYVAYVNLLNDSLELRNFDFEFKIGLKAEVSL